MRVPHSLRLLPLAFLLAPATARIEAKDLIFDPRYTGTDCGGYFHPYWAEIDCGDGNYCMSISLELSTINSQRYIVAYGEGADEKDRIKKCSFWTHFYNTKDEDVEISFQPFSFNIMGLQLDKGLVMRATVKQYFEFQKDRANDLAKYTGPIWGPFGPASTSYYLSDPVQAGPDYCTGGGLDKKNVKQNTLRFDMTFSIEEGNPPWADTSDANELPAGGRVGEESPTALLAFAAVNVKEGCSN